MNLKQNGTGNSSNGKDVTKKSRPTTSLTPTQLERKRRIDRENQKVKRARNKGRMQELEKLVLELKDQLQESKKTINNLIQKQNAVEDLVNANVINQERPHSYRTSTPAQELQPLWDSNLIRIEELPDEVVVEFTADKHNQLDTASELEIDPLDIDTQHCPLDDFWSDSSRKSHIYRIANLEPYILWPFNMQLDTPIWTCTPKVAAPNTPLERALEEIVYQGVHLTSPGIAEERFCPVSVAVASSLFPSTSPSKYPICSLAVKQLINLFGPAFRGKLANFIPVLYIIYAVIRWRICPSPETYESIPQWLKPLPDQIGKQHPCWMDFFPWPTARPKLIDSFEHNLLEGRLGLFSKLCSITVSVNWTKSSGSDLFRHGPSGVMLDPAYETHLNNLENWSLSASLATEFPFLNGSYGASEIWRIH